ncbi:hypothetical protein G4B84_011416 [Aspergillus flavus NRRL3357]|nr:uncharacterized protein G4B84_011416 [Aspergillus flavus NRRL3357]QMW35887.1 hypothetical protein G4B84_011416 [Aspergillus flavus NRRL3357]QMW47949.1 hypothetical protein G4B11_011467 [Aspergillus flavus]
MSALISALRGFWNLQPSTVPLVKDPYIRSWSKIPQPEMNDTTHNPNLLARLECLYEFINSGQPSSERTTCCIALAQLHAFFAKMSLRERDWNLLRRSTGGAAARGHIYYSSGFLLNVQLAYLTSPFRYMFFKPSRLTSTSTAEWKMDQFFKFLAVNPRIKYARPTWPDFGGWRAGFVVDEDTIPAVIVRPRFAEDVAALVSVLATNNVPFSVRVGGHDMFGRSQIHDAVTIDLREIAYVDIDHTGHTARLGGGILVAGLIKELEKDNLVTPHGVIPGVGYVGWATHGGYGLLSTQYGLGVDQILDAQVVDCEGRIRHADKDMLKAIRGAGGLLGIIVEVTIKVYPLGQVLAGAIIYESSNLSAAIRHYNNGYHQLKQDYLPSSLSLYQSVMNGPSGKALTVLFCWASSDMETGLLWLSKVQAFSPVAMCTVSPTTMAAFTLATELLMPKSVHGTMLTANIHELTPEVVDVIGFHSSLQPNDSAIVFGIHELRVCTPVPSLDSVIYTRSPHFVLEIGAIVETPHLLPDAIKWGQSFYNAVHKTDLANIMPSTYLPLTGPEKVDMGAIYGPNLEVLRDIKQRYDPRDVFRHALVKV